VELFEEIHREYRFEVGAIQGEAKKLNMHRRTVRQALASAIPLERKAPARSSPKLRPLRRFIDGNLQSDREAPHTASGCGLARSIPRRAWRKRRCGATCGGERKNWVWRGERRSCRRATTGAWKPKWIGPSGLVRGCGRVRLTLYFTSWISLLWPVPWLTLKHKEIGGVGVSSVRYV
jgi:hypothetical protein